MDAELKTEWIKRLTSGEYEQGQERLRNADIDDQGQETGKATFCCLGVLCDVLKDRGLGEWNGDAFAQDKTIFKSEYESESYDLEGELNDPVLGYVGIHHTDQIRLIGMNDTEEQTFDEIAEFIAVQL